MAANHPTPVPVEAFPPRHGSLPPRGPRPGRPGGSLLRIVVAFTVSALVLFTAGYLLGRVAGPPSPRDPASFEEKCVATGGEYHVSETNTPYCIGGNP